MMTVYCSLGRFFRHVTAEEFVFHAGRAVGICEVAYGTECKLEPIRNKRDLRGQWDDMFRGTDTSALWFPVGPNTRSFADEFAGADGIALRIGPAAAAKSDHRFVLVYWTNLSPRRVAFVAQSDSRQSELEIRDSLVHGQNAGSRIPTYRINLTV